MKLHTILGAGGTISNALYPLLLAKGEKVRIVSRKAKPVEGAESVAADVTNYKQVLNAVEGSDIVYLLVGLPYDVRVWQQSWPLVMTNVINACKATGSKLIFFDNVYMYGKVNGPMTEQTPFNPCSKKGEIRAAIAMQLLNEMKTGNLKALIARAADFYGPVGFKTSVPNILVFKNLKAGHTAQWIANARVPHSFTYVPDAAQALTILSDDDTAFGQTWHMPTAANPLTGEQFVKLAVEFIKAKDGVTVLSKWMMQLMGIFIRPLKESVEMIYQSEYPYIFDSSRFNVAYNFTPITYEAGIRETAIWTLGQS